MGQTLIAMTSTDRPDYLRQSLESWLNVEGFGDYRLIIRQEPTPHRRACLDVIEELVPWADVIQNYKKLGPLVNPWQAIDDGFNEDASFVVYAEDDVIVADDVLNYMEWCSKEYESDQSVLGVVAMNRTYQSGDDRHQICRGKKWPANVFGVWADRWFDFIRDDWDKTYRDRGWDWHLSNVLVARDLDAITPLWSRSQHIGKFGGTHMPSRAFEQHQAESFQERYPEGAWFE